MSRFKKLLTAAAILGLGIGLAWPFRKADSQSTGGYSDDVRQQGQILSVPPIASSTTESMRQGIANSRRHVVAKTASSMESPSVTRGSTTPAAAVSFDLANHPAASSRVGEAPITPTFQRRASTTIDKVPVARPAYETVEQGFATEGNVSEGVLHVVRNSDTLEKLAKRYLGDGGRALEIFDLNRDKLENPHLLPIGAKLRIPVNPGRLND